jgi:hypothetical protein
MLRRLPEAVICFFGEGAANQGTFHESLNMAALWRLPCARARVRTVLVAIAFFGFKQPELAAVAGREVAVMTAVGNRDRRRRKGTAGDLQHMAVGLDIERLVAIV